MLRTPSVFLLSSALALAACVTINVYFPAAAAEQVADRIIDDVWGSAPRPGQSAPAPQGSPEPQSRWHGAGITTALLDALIPVAEAQEQPNLDASSPEVRRITAAMEARHAQLLPHYESGAVGLTSNGDITIRDAAQVALAQRNAVRSLVNEENADRAALYRQIAVANNQPKWEDDIRAVFAQRWVARARSGWWHQDAAGDWVQK